MMKDLTTGSPMRLILGFGLPTLLGMLFQQFYNLMDTMIVGKLLGAGALAAVGSTSSISFLVIGFCMGVCNGLAIPGAQRVGGIGPGRMRRRPPPPPRPGRSRGSRSSHWYSSRSRDTPVRGRPGTPSRGA